MNKLFGISSGITLSLLYFFLSSFYLHGQNKDGMVKYSTDFKFRDGIYLNFSQVKQNSPIPKAKLLSSIDYNDREFFGKLLENNKIYFYDDIGVRQEVPTDIIWGYSRNGVLYYQLQGAFNKITFVGSICHFVADITTYDGRSYGSPYGYDPYYSPFSYYPYGLYYSPYSQSGITRTELKQFLIDFESGKILDFNLKNTEILIMKDLELYNEYIQLSGKKKRELKFVYIRKFNERNPLYIPIYKNN